MKIIPHKSNNTYYYLDYDEWKSSVQHDADDSFELIFSEFAKLAKGYMISPATLFDGPEGVKPVVAKSRTMSSENEILDHEDISEIYLYKILKNRNEFTEPKYKIRYGKYE